MILNWVKRFFVGHELKDIQPLLDSDKEFLISRVAFYRSLNQQDKLQFEARIRLFLKSTEIIGNDVEVTFEDELLVASGAVIPVWSFPKWHYINLNTVYLVSGSFNEQSEFGKPDSTILGLVGSGHLSGSMILSKPALHLGFSNDKDKQNLAIHEFVHLIDMSDGQCDGLLESLNGKAHYLPWLELMRKKTLEIVKNKSNIRDYAASNQVEFLAVVSEYFFERPKMLKQKHPEVYKALSHLYKQDGLVIEQSIKQAKKSLCHCGSGKRYKRCCLKKV